MNTFQVALLLALVFVAAFLGARWERSRRRRQIDVLPLTVEADRLQAGRRHQAELVDEERLRAQREVALAVLRERKWQAPEIEKVMRP